MRRFWKEVTVDQDDAGWAVRLDGRAVQRDGRFLDPALAVLNAGLEGA